MFKFRKTALASLLSLSLAMSCLIVTPITVLAADLSVNFDGERLIYKDPEAQPQIINDRTMVPLRETAEYFGMDFTWNAESSTMVFIGHGRTVIHTTNSDTIYVNGAAFNYNYTSAVINGRTMMPIRMLAEAIGCEVEWIGETATVDIRSEYYSPGTAIDEPVPTPVPVVSAAVSVYSAKVSPETVSAGDTVTVTLSTSKSATRAKVTDSSGNIFDEITDYTEDSQGRYFTFYIPLTEEGNNSLRVYAGNDSSYSASYKVLTVTVDKAAEKLAITAIDIDETELEPGAKVEGIIRTSRNTSKIVIKDSDKKIIDTITQADYRGSEYKDWSFEFYLEEEYDEDVEELVFSICAYDENEKEVSDNFTIKFPSEDSASNKGPTINRVFYDYEIDGGYYQIIFTVRTDDTAVEVELYDDNNELIAYQSTHSGSTIRVFEIEYSTDDDSQVRIFKARAYNSKNKYTELDFELELG